MARSLFGIVINRLRETNYAAPRWLQRDDSLRRVLKFAVREHVSLGPEHQVCQNRAAAILILWVNYTRSILTGGTDFLPGTEIVVLRTPSMTISRTTLGIEVMAQGR
jgi:hypothetical protein